MADRNDLLALSGKAWDAYNVLKVLHFALDDDAADCDVPTRSLVGMVMRQAEALADALANLSDEGARHG